MVLSTTTTAVEPGIASAADAKTLRPAHDEAGGHEPGAEEGAGGSFALLIAWLAGAVPPAPKGRGHAANAPSALVADAARSAAAVPERGVRLPPCGNSLPPLPLLLPPASSLPEQAASDRGFGLAPAGGTGGEAFSAASIATLREAASAASTALRDAISAAAPADTNPAPSRSVPAALDLSFLAGAVAAEGSPSTPSPSTAASGAGTPSPGQLRLDHALGRGVVFMVEHGMQDARVRVHPEHLGPIDIRLKVDGDAAQVTFHAQHGLVRDALTDAVPRLRELLGDSGLTLVRVDVDAGGGFDARGSGGRTRSDAHPGGGPLGAEPVEAEPEMSRAAMRIALVDTFA